MNFRQELFAWARGDQLDWFWKLFFARQKTKNRLWKDILTVLISRSAMHHGGYVGKDTQIASRLLTPHGLHGIYLSRYASIGKNCWMYQNVTVGEVSGKAPVIGDDCLIGAGAILVGDIKIGDRVKIGAGAVVSQDVPDDATVVCEKPRIIVHSKKREPLQR